MGMGIGGSSDGGLMGGFGEFAGTPHFKNLFEARRYAEGGFRIASNKVVAHSGGDSQLIGVWAAARQRYGEAITALDNSRPLDQVQLLINEADKAADTAKALETLSTGAPAVSSTGNVTMTKPVRKPRPSGPTTPSTLIPLEPSFTSKAIDFVRENKLLVAGMALGVAALLYLLLRRKDSGSKPNA